jgi:hypothetical protein
MDDRIVELLYRNLQEVFGEGNAAPRRATIEDFYTEDRVLHVPPSGNKLRKPTSLLVGSRQ